MTITASETTGNQQDREYADYIGRISARVADLIAGGHRLFLTDASPEELWDVYLTSFEDPAERQHHNCSACRHFLQRFGGAVVIADDGALVPVLWQDIEVPERYLLAARRLRNLVSKRRITGPLVTAVPVLGTPQTGPWSHYALTLPASYVFPANRALTAGQKAAEQREDFKNVKRALVEFPEELLGQALTLLAQETLDRSEKVLGPVKWLRDLQGYIAQAKAKGARRDNVIWKAVASAPPGFCHPRSSMAGTLLEDLERGLSFEEVSRRWKEKMHPLQYQRPQAPPTAGNIKRGEEIIAKLGLQKSLERRFARIEEVQTIWRTPPPVEPEATRGVFGHLTPKGEEERKAISVPATKITFEKFIKTVLDKATAVDIYINSGIGSFYAMLTAEHPDAPPIFQWDAEEARNPFSWYTYPGGSTASQWGLSAGFHPVSGVLYLPNMWTPGKYEHQGKGAIFAIPGCRDSRESGNGLFPECLKSDLREVRATIEAYSRSAKVGGREEASANGIGFSDSIHHPVRVRATVNGQSLNYEIDRWD